MSKESPILMNGAMVRAVLDGSKTQTRRIMRPQPVPIPGEPGKHWWPSNAAQSMMRVEDCFQQHPGIFDDACPYGQPGDRIWVRETWGVISHAWDEACNLIDWVPDRPATAISEMPFGKGYYSGHVIYAVDGAFEWSGDDDGDGDPRSAWHPSIHMPRRASRILLEIVSVRVERLQDISDADIAAEGVECSPIEGRYNCAGQYHMPWRDKWRALWKSTGGDWDANPWCWVVTFKRVMSCAT